MKTTPASLHGGSAVMLAILLSLVGSMGVRGADYPQVTGEWNINIPSVRIQGRFLLGSRPFPDSFLEGANFFLRNDATGDEVYLGLSNNQDFDRLVVPGTYDVVYEHKIGQQVPRNVRAIVYEDLAIPADMAFDIDVPMIGIHGAFLLRGEPAPESSLETGLIHVRDRRSGALTPVGETHNQTYAIHLIPGTYDLIYSRLSGSDDVPANQLTAFQRDVPLLASGLMDIDVPMITLSGNFRINGALAPDSNLESGNIRLLDPDTGTVFLGATSVQSYQATVIPGTYDVHYERLAGGDTAPANSSARFQTGVSLVADAIFDIDLPVAGISGAFLVNGAPAPDSALENARIRLRNGEDAVYLGETQFGHFSVLVLHGTYQVGFEGMTGGDIMPANKNALLNSVTVDSPSVFDINIPTARFTADIEFNGSNFPGSQAGEQARIYLEDNGTSDLILLGSYPAFDQANRLVIPGSYQVRYSYESGAKLPRNQFAPIGREFRLKRGTHHAEINIQAAALAGTFTLNGGNFPGGPGQNAAIVLASMTSGDSLLVGGTAGGAYSTVVIPGRYDAMYNWAQGDLIPRNQNAPVDGARVRRALSLSLGSQILPDETE